MKQVEVYAIWENDDWLVISVIVKPFLSSFWSGAKVQLRL